MVKGKAFWNTTSEVLPIFEDYFGPAPRCGICAIGVEPNPRHTPRLSHLQAVLRAAGAPVLWLHETAADVADGFTTLNLNAGGGMDVNDVGMKVKPLSAKNSLPVKIKKREKNEKEAGVATIDLSKLILTVREELRVKATGLSGGAAVDGFIDVVKPNKVVMKLDIEGAEYRVVQHLLDQDALCALDLVFLEWHEIDKRKEEQQRLLARINRELEKCDTVISPIDDETFMFDGKDFPTAGVCHEL